MPSIKDFPKIDAHIHFNTGRLDKYPQMAVDLAERINHLYVHASRDHEKVVIFFEKYQDRIIYGTDIIDDPEQGVAAIIRDLQDRWETHWQFFSTTKKLSSDQLDASFVGLDLPELIIKKYIMITLLNGINFQNLIFDQHLSCY